MEAMENIGDDFKEHLSEYIELYIKEAINNSYKLITKMRTFDEMVDEAIESKKILVLLVDPDTGATKKELQAMIDYFVDGEEYEKCSELKSILEKIE